MEFKSNSGYTLLELLIGTGISSILIAGIMAFQNFSQKTSQDIESKYHMQTLHNKIINILQSPEACMLTLSTPHTITNSIGAVLYRAGGIYENGKIRILSIGSGLSTADTSSHIGTRINIRYAPANNPSDAYTITKIIHLTLGASSCVASSARTKQSSFSFTSCTYDEKEVCFLKCPHGYTVLSSIRLKGHKQSSLVGLCQD